jgi:hypothetical protein
MLPQAPVKTTTTNAPKRPRAIVMRASLGPTHATNNRSGCPTEVDFSGCPTEVDFSGCPTEVDFRDSSPLRLAWIVSGQVPDRGAPTD